jgi:hypothetical protein
MYEKFSTFLRVEVCVNRMKDPGLNKGLLTRIKKRSFLIIWPERIGRLAGF